MPEESLIPPPVSARAESRGRFPFGFAPRFFTALLLGLLWLIPAWWDARFAAAMFLWDALLLAAWLTDLLRLPRAGEIEARREWGQALALGHPAAAALQLRNHSRVPIHAALVDHTPVELRDRPPALFAVLPPGDAARQEYPLRPGKRGDLSMGRLYLRYRSVLGLAVLILLGMVARLIRREASE